MAKWWEYLLVAIGGGLIGGGAVIIATRPKEMEQDRRIETIEGKQARYESQQKNLEAMVFEFENRYFSDKKGLDMEVNQIWNLIRQHEQMLADMPELRNKVNELYNRLSIAYNRNLSNISPYQ